MLFNTKVYWYSMPWNSLNLTAKDKEVLRSFFTKNPDEKGNIEYLERIQRWKSTNELNSLLDEPGKRTKKRLLKLKGFGILQLESFENGKRWDHYWYISIGGVYFLLSIMKRPSMIKFLRANHDIREFELIEDQLTSNKVQVEHLIDQIRTHTKLYQYNKIISSVNAWFKEVYGRAPTRLPIEPSIWVTVNKTSKRKNNQKNQ